MKIRNQMGQWLGCFGALILGITASADEEKCQIEAQKEVKIIQAAPVIIGMDDLSAEELEKLQEALGDQVDLLAIVEDAKNLEFKVLDATEIEENLSEKLKEAMGKDGAKGAITIEAKPQVTILRADAAGLDKLPEKTREELEEALGKMSETFGAILSENLNEDEILNDPQVIEQLKSAIEASLKQELEKKVTEEEKEKK